MKASRAAIDLFFRQKRIAIVGVSRKRAHFSRLVFSSFRKCGYDTVPVNHAAQDIDGVVAAPSLDAVAPAPEAVLVLSAKAPESIIGQAAAAGARVLWFYRKPKFAIASPPAGLDIVAGECPLMFLQCAGWIHAAHRRVRSFLGALPE